MGLKFQLSMQKKLLGAFAEVLRATTSFVMSVYPSVYLRVLMEQLGYHWTDFHEIWYMAIFRKFIKIFFLE
jgi:hypothetical protein